VAGSREVVRMEVGAVLIFAIPLAITIVLAFVFLSRRNAFARAFCIVFQFFAFAILYSVHQYLLSLQIESFIGLLAGWASLFVVVVMFIEAIAWLIETIEV
jgi:hypothetical protein